MAVLSAPLVERELELAALERLLAGVREGGGGAVVVEGPPGIGKSSLLAAARAAAAELWVVSARGGELEREFPFAIVRQLFEPVLMAADAAERERLLAGAAGLAEPVLFTPAANGGADAFSALHGLYWLAVNLAEVQPLLVVVDDLHWADLASLRWLLYLARRLEGVPLALVLATRPAEPGAAQELLDDLVAIPTVELVQPDALSEQAVGGLAAQLLPAAPEPQFVAACHRATGGNPFLLRELFEELSRRGIAPNAESAGLASELSSQGVGRAVRGRLRRLGPECAALARAVAVLGDRADPALATRLARLDEQGASRAADALAEAAILEPGRPLAFVHPLVRSSVYAELSEGERAAEHDRAARMLADAGAAADRIAIHLLAAQLRAEAETVSTLRRAAAAAAGRGATEVAVAYLRRALAEPPAPELEPHVLHELGAAELQAGQIEAAIEHLTAALERTTEASRRAAVALELARAWVVTDRAPDAVDLLSEAIDALSGGEGELTTSLVAMRALVGWSSLAARERLPPPSDPPLAVGATPRTTGERLALGRQAFEAMLSGTAEQARSLALRALGDGDLLEATAPHYPPVYFALAALLWGHAFEDAERHFQGALRVARSHGSQLGFAIASHFRARLCWERGALAELEADAQSAPAHTAPMAFPLAAVSLADALVARGEVEGAAAQLRGVGLDAGTPPLMIGVLAVGARARVRLAQQRPEEALALLFECGRFEDAWQVVTPSLTSWRAEAAVLLERLGDAQRARRLASEAVGRADAFGSPVAQGIALRAAALVARPPDHDGLVASVALLRGGGARLELARSLVELGAALRRSGHRSEAREPLREAVEVAVECGADALATRAHHELLAAGARPRRDPTESRSKLTAAELRVARLAAEGMTNREVAQALFVTENTIETHLRSVFRKLDIRSRSQLARAL